MHRIDPDETIQQDHGSGTDPVLKRISSVGAAASEPRSEGLFYCGDLLGESGESSAAVPTTTAARGEE
jgi:hypothetical protein